MLKIQKRVGRNKKNIMTKTLQQLIKGIDKDFDKALSDGKVQIMRLKNRIIKIGNDYHKDKNLFDIFIDHQDDGLFTDYVREHSQKKTELLLKASYVIAFVADDKYSRFAGIYKINGLDTRTGLNNSLFLDVTQIHAFDKYGGRLLVDWGGTAAQQWLQWFKTDKKVLRIDEGIIRMMIPFTKHEDILLDFKELNNIIKTENIEWRNKLSAVNGIYCIADRSNGKLYVGSAYGNDGIWGRWKVYVETNGHGGNNMLVEIINKQPDYAWDNFQWFVLETLPLSMKDSEIIERESFYKSKLCTRKWGYNKN